MRIVHDYGLVRVVSLGDPFNNTYDIRVENYDSDADIWRLWRGFNSFSDDYAYNTYKSIVVYNSHLSLHASKFVLLHTLFCKANFEA